MITLSNNHKNLFKKNGQLTVKNILDKKTINKLRNASYDLFNGKYLTNIAPDKVKWSLQNKIINNKQPRQLANIWKSHHFAASVILSKTIGKLASELMGWNGVRLSQDSLIWVPVNSGGVSMHQDEVYQDWHVPGKLITAWIPLLDVNENSGGLEFLPGSHKWKKLSKPIKQFFSGVNYKRSLNKFRKYDRSQIVVSSFKIGEVSFHHGKLWHGSGINKSNKERIAITCHYMPMNSKFHSKVNHPVLSHYKKFTTCEMDENFFPIVWSKNNMRSKFLSKMK